MKGSNCTHWSGISMSAERAHASTLSPLPDLIKGFMKGICIKRETHWSGISMSAESANASSEAVCPVPLGPTPPVSECAPGGASRGAARSTNLRGRGVWGERARARALLFLVPKERRAQPGGQGKKKMGKGGGGRGR